MLDWVGDVGGLLDGLMFLGSFVVAPIAAFAMNVELSAVAFNLERQNIFCHLCSKKRDRYQRVVAHYDR